MQKRVLSVFIFIVYIAVLIKVMVFKDVPMVRVGQLMLNFGGTDAGHGPNFIPFATIGPYLLGHNGWIIAGINLAGNIGLLVPLGFLAVLVFPNISWKKSLIAAALSGLAIESMQTILHVGIFDIDDVLLNALGFMMGYWAFLYLAKWLRERKYAYIGVAALIVIAAGAGALYVVYPWGQPVNPGPGAQSMQSGSAGNRQEGEVPQSGDLCGGTGGTGEIVSKGSGTIALKSKMGDIQTITLTDSTEIRNSAGPIPASDLKIGDHVTVVILDEHKTATTVLVCKV